MSNKWIVLIIINLLIFNIIGCKSNKINDEASTKFSSSNFSNNLPTESSVEKENFMFYLSDKEINEAIDNGKKYYQQINDYLDKAYKLSPNDKKYNTLVEARLLTPFHFIVADAAYKRSISKNNEFFEGGREVHFKSAKEYLNHSISSKSIVFKIRLYGNDVDCHKSTTINLVQDGRIIQIPLVMGLENQAKKTLNQQSLQYYKDVNVIVSSKDGSLNFSNKAQLKVVIENIEEIIFDIDFSKYK